MISLFVEVLFTTFSLFGIVLSPFSQDTDYAKEKTSPFSAVQFKKDKIWVKVETEWHEFLKMDEVESAYLLEECKKLYEDEYKKRFIEDFVEFLHKIEIKPKAEENFFLADEKGNKAIKSLTFTRENRASARAFFKATDDLPLDLKQSLSKEQMLEDLQEFESILQRRYSYLYLRGNAGLEQLEALKTQVEEGMIVQDFGAALQKIINHFGDGHSRVSKLDLKSMGRLPFKTTAFKEKIVCHKDQQLLDPEYPYLHSINGIPVDQLLKIVQVGLVPKGSPQFIKTHTAERLAYIGFVLKELQQYQDELKVLLSNEAGETISKDFSILHAKPEVKSREEEMEALKRYKPFTSDILKGNIGYLKIERMKSMSPAKQVEAEMKKLENTKGLIIDVRDNGGGQRTILKELIPYFIAPDQSPIIGNLAVYRTNRTNHSKEGYLRDRSLYPLTYINYTPEDRLAIKQFMETFDPQHKFDLSKFSDWHFLLLKASSDKKFYDQKVIVLMDAGCFSATDIFLSSFNELPNVITMGTKSGGGSGRTRRYKLQHSRLELRLSSIISFQPTGDLYDGIGVSPDQIVELQKLTDVLGTSDYQLKQAIQVLKK